MERNAAQARSVEARLHKVGDDVLTLAQLGTDRQSGEGSRKSEDGQYLWQSLWQFVAMTSQLVPIPAELRRFMPKLRL